MPGTLMSPQQFSSQMREEGKKGSVVTTAAATTTTAGSVKSKGADIGLTRDQMQEALMYMIQVSCV